MTVPAGRTDVGPPGAMPGGEAPVRRWHAEFAWLGRGSRAVPDVLIEASGERFIAVTPNVPPSALPPGTTRLAGLTLPGPAWDEPATRS